MLFKNAHFCKPIVNHALLMSIAIPIPLRGNAQAAQTPGTETSAPQAIVGDSNTSEGLPRDPYTAPNGTSRYKLTPEEKAKDDRFPIFDPGFAQ